MAEPDRAIRWRDFECSLRQQKGAMFAELAMATRQMTGFMQPNIILAMPERSLQTRIGQQK